MIRLHNIIRILILEHFQVFCCTWNMGEVEPVNDIVHLFDNTGDHISGFSSEGKIAHDIYAIGKFSLHTIF